MVVVVVDVNTTTVATTDVNVVEVVLIEVCTGGVIVALTTVV